MFKYIKSIFSEFFNNSYPTTEEQWMIVMLNKDSELENRYFKGTAIEFNDYVSELLADEDVYVHCTFLKISTEKSKRFVWEEIFGFQGVPISNVGQSI